VTGDGHRQIAAASFGHPRGVIGGRAFFLLLGHEQDVASVPRPRTHTVGHTMLGEPSEVPRPSTMHMMPAAVWARSDV
jgi:hypothetical protein